MKEWSAQILELKKRGSNRFSDGGERPWLAADVDSYGAKSNRVILHVLQGSPPPAFILENASTGHEFAILFDSRGKVIGRRKRRFGQ